MKLSLCLSLFLLMGCNRTGGGTPVGLFPTFGGPSRGCEGDICLYIRGDIDQGAGAGTADCAFVARLNDNTEILIMVLVPDGECP